MPTRAAVEQSSSRAGVASAEVRQPSRRTLSPSTLFSENSEQSVTEENGFRHVAGVQYKHGINSLGNNVMKVSRVTTSVIFLCAAGSIAWLFISIAPGDRPTPSAAIGSAVAFVVASEGVFLRPRFSYWLGLVSGIVALYWFSRIEFRYFPALNSWIAFNLPDGNPQFSSDVFLAKLKILLVVIKIVNGITYDMAGNVLKRFGFHCFRHTLASFLLAQGNNPVLIKNLLRWSKISMLDTYGHVMTDEKIAAQGSMLERIIPKTNALQ